MKSATALRIRGYMSHLLSKVTICLSAVTYVTARARTARILYNIFTVGRFAGGVVKGLRGSKV